MPTVLVIFVRVKLLNDLLPLSCSFVRGSHYNPFTSHGFQADGRAGWARTRIWFSHNNTVLVYLQDMACDKDLEYCYMYEAMDRIPIPPPNATVSSHKLLGVTFIYFNTCKFEMTPKIIYAIIGWGFQYIALWDSIGAAPLVV